MTLPPSAALESSSRPQTPTSHTIIEPSQPSESIPESIVETPAPPHHHVPAPAPIQSPLHKTSKLSWGLLGMVITVLPFFFCRLHYALPEPQAPYDESGRPQPSEEIVLSHITALEEIGYRTVGTPQALAGEQYVLDRVLELVDKCNAGGILNCEWWHQKGSGFHAFEILDHEVLKGYIGLSNIILKINAFRPPSHVMSQPRLEKDAVLLGSHIDSTMPSPGASDDGIGVGVMLDVARVLVETNKPFDNSVIFLWNGGEETLQDGSHLYSTSHATASAVRAVINLEAAGTKGGTLLFQATSKEMIEAFQHAPYPKGTVIAADVFSSGIIMSDTDFGQFEKYLGVSGLDMAVVGHSYFYHTHKDTVANIEKGTAQHFTSNVHAIVSYLLSPASPLRSETPFSPPDLVYLSIFDKYFFYWSMDKADQIYTAIGAVAAALCLRNLSGRGWKAVLVSAVGTPLAVVSALLGSNVLAWALLATNNGQMWFRHEHSPLIIYLPTAFSFLLFTHFFLSKWLSPVERAKLEVTHYYVQLMYSALSMLVLQVGRIRSAYVYALITGALLVGAVGNEFGRLGRSGRSEGMNFKLTYLLPSAGLTLFCVEAVTSALDIFTPLTGRMGKSAPSEHIIAVLSSMCGIIFTPTLIPLFHRLSRGSQRKVMLGLSCGGAAVVALGAMGTWKMYDPAHPKRFAVNYNYNHTSNKHTAHLASMDRGPLMSIPETIYSEFGTPSYPLDHTILTDYDSDWDVLYPVSTFLDTWKFDVPDKDRGDKDFDWPKMKHKVRDVKREEGVRQMHLTLDFTGLVWPTLAFEGAVLDWSFPFPPPTERKRHHIKIATSMDTPIVEINLVVKAKKWEKIQLHWSAFDLNQMVPSTSTLYGPDMPASKFLTSVKDFISEKWGEDLDLVSSGVVCGVINV